MVETSQLEKPRANRLALTMYQPLNIECKIAGHKTWMKETLHILGCMNRHNQGKG